MIKDINIDMLNGFSVKAQHDSRNKKLIVFIKSETKEIFGVVGVKYAYITSGNVLEVGCRMTSGKIEPKRFPVS